jgi:hypothetical protein
MRLTAIVTALVALLLASACSSGNADVRGNDDIPCNPATCSTCCDVSGRCVAALSAATCPSDHFGSACEACPDGDACYPSGQCGRANPPVAFVTNAEFDGDLAVAGGVATGLLGGDALCQAAAANAGLSGRFRAWLSDATTNAIDRLADVGGWYTISWYWPPRQIFASAAQLATGPSAAFTDEHGDYVSRHPWTGTKVDGTRVTSTMPQGSGNCLDWTASWVDSGATGNSNSISVYGFWTNAAAQQCQNRASIYCFQQ